MPKDEHVINLHFYQNLELFQHGFLRRALGMAVIWFLMFFEILAETGEAYAGQYHINAGWNGGVFGGTRYDGADRNYYAEYRCDYTH